MINVPDRVDYDLTEWYLKQEALEKPLVDWDSYDEIGD